jgi:hypothetical protein
LTETLDFIFQSVPLFKGNWIHYQFGLNLLIIITYICLPIN